jgi:hypothetical protein
LCAACTVDAAHHDVTTACSVGFALAPVGMYR